MTKARATASAAAEPPVDRATLRQRIADALTAEAYRCDGNCGLPERECYDAHPITFSAMAGDTTHVDGAVTAIADVVLSVLPKPADRAAVLREAAADVVAYCPEHGDRETCRIACHCEIADELRRMADQAQPAAAYSDGKDTGRVYCLTCPRPADVTMPLTIDAVADWELCPSCGRRVVDVARTAIEAQRGAEEDR